MSTCWSDATPLHWCAICMEHRVSTPTSYLCPRCADPGLKVTPLQPKTWPPPSWAEAWGAGSA